MKSENSGSFHKVGIFPCAALVVANMIGTGVFTSLGYQVGDLPSPFVILLLWVVGGVVAFCGALVYCELAVALPKSGGEYHFLSQIYHPSVGFAAGFVSVAIGFAAPIALVAMAFGDYLSAAIPGLHPRMLSYALLLSVAAMHTIAVGASGAFQVTVTALKVAVLIGFLVIGFSRGNLAEADFSPTPEAPALLLSPAFAVSLMFVLYSYTGWNAVTYILSEVKNVQRTIPLALLIATALVSVIYVALNMLFLRSEPMASYEGQIEVAEIAATALFGDNGGRLMAGLVGGGLIASLSAMTWAGPRVSQAIGRDLPAFRFLQKTSPGGVPRRALLLQTLVALVFLATATFETVLIYAQFALVACSFLTVLGIFVLRRRQPEASRHFRCWGYPVTPLVYLAVTAFALLYTATEKPWEAVAGALTLAFGLLLYFLSSQRGLTSRQVAP